MPTFPRKKELKERSKKVKYLFRKKPLRYASRKNQTRLREYGKLRHKLLRDAFCEFPEGCIKRAQDVHHSAGRRGDNLLKESTLWLLCRDHHNFVHNNSKWARKHGLLKL